ncbi:MAG: hypothetical protein E7287_02630 [Lachnospiraceae bacterium]|nr:hypothetical protein [Lachnospiraceae bacterium]
MTMKEINEYYKSLIEAHMEENALTAKDSLDYLNNSTAKYKGKPIYSLYMPQAFPKEVAEYLKTSVETMYGILIKIMKEYLSKADYRELFGFPKELEELILRTPKYETLLPICRLDIFYDEENGGFKFCEFNADGCSSMNEDREMNIALKLTKAYLDMEREYEIHSFELFDSWANAFLEIYQSGGYEKELPNVAVVDFLELGCSMEEFEQFAKSFRKLGMQAQVCEIRDLTFDGEHLYASDGMVIDAIYRRAVTSDIFKHKQEIPAFMDAVKAGKVCLIGDFCTQIVHDKTLFYLLNKERTYSFLTQDEIAFLQEHIPYTTELMDKQIADSDILGNKNGWIIKPKDSYGAKGVYAGVNFSQSEWEGLVNTHKNADYIMQEFVMPYRSWNIDFRKKTPAFRKYSSLTGMYVYNGKFAGFYSRQADHEIISSEYDENDVPSVWVEKKA